MSVEILSVIICDDVRKEVSQKDILIGVYGGEINVGSYPAPLKLSFWIETMNKAVGKSDLTFKIESPSGNPPIEISVEMQSSRIGPGALVLQGLPILAERDGNIIISMSINGGESKALKKKRVARGALPQMIFSH